MWQFTINDYTTGNLVATIIQEPAGWDAVNLHLKRDERAHGFFSFEDDTFSSLQYDGNGAQILRNAYYNYGVQANVQLSVGCNCDGEDNDPNLYLGTFDFTTFKDYTSDRCYVEIALLGTQSYYLLKNRLGQQVDLDSLASFDQLPVPQTITCNAVFEGATQPGVLNQIRVGILLNGLMPGSKIAITGSTQDGTYTVASAKPDYSGVNPDLASGGESSALVVSATFDANNNTIDINQLINIAVGADLTLITATWPSGNIHYTVYDNSGTYKVLSVQQFFNYTRLTVALVSLTPATPSNTLNYQGTPYMVATTQDTVTLTGGIIYTSQPTATIITVAETLVNETSVLVTFSGQWLQNNLQPYSGLSKIITVPAKVIEATSIWKQVTPQEYSLYSPTAVGTFNGPVFFSPAWVNVQSDIDETDVATGIMFYVSQTANPFEDFAYFRQDALACTGLATLVINISGQFTGINGFTAGEIFDPLPPGGSIGPSQSKQFRIRVVQNSIWEAGLADSSVLPPGTEIINDIITLNNDGTFTYSSTVPGFTFGPGQYLWVFFGIYTQSLGAYLPAMLINADSYCSLTINSQCEDTPCSVYLINESLSRCAESITNGQIQVYSDYFGRKNAQPVASPVDGCGGLACITNGLRIRGCIMPDGSAIPKFFTSLDDMFTALDAIHNIGMAIEPDPNRPGYLRLRVEPFEHWFQNTVLLTCLNIMSYTRETVTSLLCSTFKCGYQQYETWNNNGIYDIFGHRKYRTPLNHLQNEIDKTCKWMASDYAIEFTRRQFGVTTSDSRYDDSTFILCLVNSYGAPVESAGSCILVWVGALAILATGDTIQVTATQSNQTTQVVSRIAVSPGNPALYYVYFAGDAFNNEYAPSATFQNLSVSGHPAINIPAFFIGANGAFALDTLDLFNAQPGDTIVVSNCAYANGTYTISSLYAPRPATTPGAEDAVDFPMIIFPATPVVLPSSAPQYDAGAIINDTTNQFYAVEQGITEGANILSPSTVMNYRISPAHCAMRHYRNIITDRQYASETLIFTGGSGNFYVLGQLTGVCTPENGNISEGGNLSLANFTVPADGEPLFYPEQVKFEYPLTWEQFLAIQANPYGLIQFQHTDEGLQSGWLVDLQYHPYTGLAGFILYPKIS